VYEEGNSFRVSSEREGTGQRQGEITSSLRRMGRPEGPRPNKMIDEKKKISGNKTMGGRARGTFAEKWRGKARTRMAQRRSGELASGRRIQLTSREGI